METQNIKQKTKQELFTEANKIVDEYIDKKAAIEEMLKDLDKLEHKYFEIVKKIKEK